MIETKDFKIIVKDLIWEDGITWAKSTNGQYKISNTTSLYDLKNKKFLGQFDSKKDAKNEAQTYWDEYVLSLVEIK